LNGATLVSEAHQILEDEYIFIKANSGGSTTINPVFTFPSSDGVYRVDGYGVQP
jgi:hypothetical protein